MFQHAHVCYWRCGSRRSGRTVTSAGLGRVWSARVSSSYQWESDQPFPASHWGRADSPPVKASLGRPPPNRRERHPKAAGPRWAVLDTSLWQRSLIAGLMDLVISVSRE